MFLGLAATVLLMAFAPAGAQTPTAEQIRMLQSLPPAQRDALLQQLGLSPGAVSGSTTPARTDQITVQPSAAGPEADAAMRAAQERDRRIKGSEQLLIELTLPSNPPAEMELARLKELRKRIITRNPYELTRLGVLQLPGFEPIPLAGLTQKEAQERLALDPLLRDFTVAVTVLRVDPQGARALKPFGYDMFRGGATAFVPGTDIPVPAGYRVGPGDIVDVQLYGQQTRTYSLPVGRDGNVSLPELGPVAVAGRGFSEVQGLLEKRVRDQMIGTQARVTLSELRSQRVLVLGDAEKPGSYVVSSLASVTNALFASGGVKPIGSLRKIEVKRAGKLMRKLDLYDVLLQGDTANDVTLQTGDVVFIPPVGPTVGIDGEIRRPAIYELAHEKTLGELVALAGGLTPEADASVVTIERVGPNGVHDAVTLDLGAPSGRAFVVRSGDVVRIAAVRPVIDNGITLAGHVYRPAVYAWRQGLRLSDVIRSIDDLKPRADTHYVLIRREAPESRRVSVVSADLSAALAAPGTAPDVLLEARDQITVFDLVSPRNPVVEPLLAELQRQSRPSDPMGIAYVEGVVNAPGAYPLEHGMRVSDLLRAGGGLQDSAYAQTAELSRQTVVDGNARRTEILTVDLAQIRAGDASADIELQPYDTLHVKSTPEWGRAEFVELRGEVKFPGRYQIRRGETLAGLVERAGGLTSIAFARGAVFTREDLKERERQELDRLATRLQGELAGLSLQAAQTDPGASQALAAGQGLLGQLRATKPVGRLVIDLDRVLRGPAHGEGDVTLRDGDLLVVPRMTEEVMVLGEVQNPTSHLYRAGMTRDEMIGLSGGFTSRADKKRAYVVRANGSVVAQSSGFRGSSNPAIEAGDSVVVPLDAEKMRPLPMWTAVTTIIYNLAIAATAIARL
ncbi:MAG: SLBB domain-containing protein [Proteobacteria bacterium]|nr:SLBB domain-containing protein [Pseudomonadota bacterium]